MVALVVPGTPTVWGAGAWTAATVGLMAWGFRLALRWDERGSDPVKIAARHILAAKPWTVRADGEIADHLRERGLEVSTDRDRYDVVVCTDAAKVRQSVQMLEHGGSVVVVVPMAKHRLRFRRLAGTDLTFRQALSEFASILPTPAAEQRGSFAVFVLHKRATLSALHRVSPP